MSHAVRLVMRRKPVLSPPVRWRVAAVQMTFGATIAENLRKIERAVRRAAHRAADVVLFPECAVTGYGGDFAALRPAEIRAALRTVADRPFKDRVLPCCRINQRIGNCYTGSVYSSLLSGICEGGPALDGKRVLMFSYGSGSVASLWSFKFRAATGEGEGQRFTLEGIQTRTNMAERLSARTRCSVAEFTAAMDLRAVKYGQAPMAPGGPLDHIAAGTYYLTGVNERHHRDYARK